MSLIKPAYLLITSFIIWLIAYLSIPATYINLGESLWFPILTLTFFNLLFVLGLNTVNGVPKKHPQISIQKKQIIILLLFGIGVLGATLRVFQRVFIQEIYFAEDLVKTRMDLMANEGNSGLIGVISAVAYPFTTVTLMLAILWIKSIRKSFFIVIFLIGLYPIYDSFLTESRLLIVFVLGMLVVTVLASKISFFKSFTTFNFHKLPLFRIPTILRRKRVFIPLIIISVGFVIFSQKVINNRLAAFGYKDTLTIWEYYHETKIDKDFKQEVKRENSIVQKNKQIGMYSLKHYFSHSVFEYVRLVNHLESSYGYYYGLFEFYTFIKFAKIIGFDIPSFSELNEVSYKPAVYTTFWGPFFIDFGVFGFIISFILGRFTKRMYLKAREGSESAILIYAFIAVIILASFFVNLAMGGNLYFLNAIFISILFIKFWPNKTVITV
ncbi:hypothetical protein BWZ20_09320 [Winogradskyella sp. J14-2]|uniref:hypothetical protein n=1 Tax=Winogradskyella sp. J14-2 TaxID=1936080 RepID=UPI000972B70A|nr:hypothetical protein [Winogradskyella sp. J14-2]APY08486.1 hypothetical protein BWZ20_09320 [Winogradskyella sp. J14-2]